jgi:7-cyano-7-deazaguanine synthase
MKADCILLLSGGIDSTTVLADLVHQDKHPVCLVFDYGQTLQAEIKVAIDNATRFGCSSEVVHLDLRKVAPGCALLQEDPTHIPQGRDRETIAAAGTPPTYVPFRNGIFLAWAVAFGEARGLERIYLGSNGLDSGNYWDDTAEFATAFTHAARMGTSPDYLPRILFPFANFTKAEIVGWGLDLGVDYGLTWSCYMPDTEPCNTCDSCIQRLDAFAANGLNPKGQPLARIPG